MRNPDLIRLQLMREKFVVHPGDAGHLKSAAEQFDFTAGDQPRQRNVMGRAAGSLCFLADAVLAVNHRRFCRLQREMQREAIVERLQILRLTLPGNLPIAVPDAPTAFANARDSRSGSIGALRVQKLAAIQIAQRQVRQVQVADVPRICLRVFAIHPLEEKRQLKSKTAAIRSFYVPRVVPPLGLEVRMIKVIARERVWD